MARRGPRIRRTDGRHRRRLEPRDWCDQRSERQERPPSGAALRPDCRLSGRPPHSHVQHEQSAATCIDPPVRRDRRSPCPRADASWPAREMACRSPAVRPGRDHEWALARERTRGRRGRSAGLPVAALARTGRRPIHRHRLLRRHARITTRIGSMSEPTESWSTTGTTWQWTGCLASTAQSTGTSTQRPASPAPSRSSSDAIRSAISSQASRCPFRCASTTTLARFSRSRCPWCGLN